MQQVRSIQPESETDTFPREAKPSPGGAGPVQPVSLSPIPADYHHCSPGTAAGTDASKPSLFTALTTTKGKKR